MKTLLLSIYFLISIVYVNAQGPNFQWAKGMGSPNSGDVGHSIAVDALGNVYTTGAFRGTVDFDPGPGIYNLSTSQFVPDVFILKLDVLGNLVWAKQLGGASDDGGNSIAVDPLGNVYTTGFYRGTGDFDPGIGTYNLTPVDSIDVFISKLDTYGNFVWAKSVGGTFNEDAYSIVLDGLGNLFALGTFEGTADFDPGAGTVNINSNGLEDIFLLKLDTSGTFVWVKSIGDSLSDFGRSVVLDKFANLYIVGDFKATVDFDPNAGSFNLSSYGGYDVFILKLNSAGNFVWAVNMGGTLTDNGCSIEVDSSSNVYATGNYNGTADFDPGVGTFNLVSQGLSDIFVFKLDASSNLLWAKSMGGTSSEVGYDINIDDSDNVYTTGKFAATVDFDPGAGINNITTAGSYDIFISKLSASGNFVWAKQMGGTGPDIANSIFIDGLGSLYTTGSFTGIADFDPSVGVFNLTSVGGNDIFINKIIQCTSPIITTTLNGTSITADQLGATYQWINCNGNTPIAGATSQTYLALANGNYAVIVSLGACSDTSICVNITGIGIEENENVSEINIYPNPTNGLFTIDLTAKAQVLITNTLGEIIFNQTLEAGKQKLNLQNQADGIYFVKLSFGGEQVVAKLIKQ